MKEFPSLVLALEVVVRWLGVMFKQGDGYELFSGVSRSLLGCIVAI